MRQIAYSLQLSTDMSLWYYLIPAILITKLRITKHAFLTVIPFQFWNKIFFKLTFDLDMNQRGQTLPF